MPAELRVFDDAERLGVALAADIVARYEARPRRRFLLGCPGGRSLRPTYRALARRRADLRQLVVVMMDEYVVDGVAADPRSHFSCRGFALREIAEPLGLAPEQVWLPDPREPAGYDERIAAEGGIDLFLLASGASDGHVAFVPPGSPIDTVTGVVELAESTRRDNLVTFPEFGSLDEVPRHGVTVGLATIAAADAARLVLTGGDKAVAASRILALDAFDPSWPASVVHACRSPEIWADRAALEAIEMTTVTRNR